MNIYLIIQQIRHNKLLTAAFILIFGASIPIALYLNIWIDEAYSLNTTSGDITYTLHQSLHFESQPPLYFLILFFWRLLHPSIFFARLLSIIFVATGLWQVHLIAKRYLPTLPNGLDTLLLSVHPAILFMATEIRCYALVFLLSVLFFRFYLQMYFQEKKDISCKAGIVIISVAGVFTQYYFAFLLFAGFFPLVGKNLRKSLEYILLMILPLASLMGFIALLSSQLQSHCAGSYFTMSAGHAIIYYLRIIETYLYGMQNLEIEYLPWLKYILRIILLGLIVFNLSRISFHEIAARINNIKPLIIIILIVSIIFIGLLLFLGKTFVLPRYTVLITLPLILSWLILIYYKRFPHLYVLILLLLFISTVIKHIPFAKNIDYKKISLFIESKERKHQPIILYHNELNLPFQYYYNGINLSYPLPIEINFSHPYDHSKWAIKDVNSLKHSMNKIPESDTIWLITDNINELYGTKFNRDILEDYMHNNYTLLQEKHFYKDITVRLLLKQ